jgi:hypothetical protein
MFKTILLAASACVALGTMPAAAQDAAPIAVAACGLMPGGQVDDEAGSPRLPGALVITFANLGNAVADSVTFDVERNGVHQLVTDSGRFSPGTTINRRFEYAAPDADGSALSTPATCSVVGVHFADGASWAH